MSKVVDAIVRGGVLLCVKHIVKLECYGGFQSLRLIVWATVGSPLCGLPQVRGGVGDRREPTMWLAPPLGGVINTVNVSFWNGKVWFMWKDWS